MTGLLSCPACRSTNTHRSRVKGTWEGWRQRVTHKRPYRCRVCHWRGWGVDRGGRCMVGESSLPALPDLDAISLPARVHRIDMDLAALDTIALPDDERTTPRATPHRI